MINDGSYALYVIMFTAFIIATIWVMITFSDWIADKLENLYTIAPANNDYTDIRELLCPRDEENLKPDIHFIPPKQRTVRLWYLDMKNKVCKPMQR